MTELETEFYRVLCRNGAMPKDRELTRVQLKYWRIKVAKSQMRAIKRANDKWERQHANGETE